MISRIRVITLVGAGAISSAGICSVYLAYTLDKSTGEALSGVSETRRMEPKAEERPREAGDEDAIVDSSARNEQAFLVAFLADADPQVRTLAAWGLMSGEEAEARQREIVEFVRHEQNPEVRAALYRFLQGQNSIKCSTLVELVRGEEDRQTWLAGCDLLAGAVQGKPTAETMDYFNLEVVPELKQSAVDGPNLHFRIAAIIALRRAGTPEAVEALREIVQTSADAQVVEAASSAADLTASVQR